MTTFKSRPISGLLAMYVAFLVATTAVAGPSIADDEVISQREKSRLHVICADINGVSGNFVVDTGAGISVLDEAFAKHLGISSSGYLSGKTPNGSVRLKEFDPVEVKVGDVLEKSIRPCGIDFSSFESLTAESFSGILGVDVLSECVLTIQGGEIRLARKPPTDFELDQALECRSTVADVVKLPIQILASVEMEWQIDTGKRSCCRLTPELISWLESKQLISKGASTPITDLSGKKRLKGHILKEVSIAGVRFRNLLVTPGSSNAIGLDLLKHLNLVLDFPNRRILIGKPPKPEVDQFPLNASGMAVGFDQYGNLTIVDIQPASTAAVAGIKPGEVIMLLENRNPADLSIDAVDEILARNGATISIRVGSEGTSRIIDLPLRLPFEYPPNWEAMEKDAAAFDQFIRDHESTDATKPTDN